MRITQDVREYAARIGVTDEAAIMVGIAEKAKEFREAGGQVYRKA